MLREMTLLSTNESAALVAALSCGESFITLIWSKSRIFRIQHGISCYRCMEKSAKKNLIGKAYMIVENEGELLLVPTNNVHHTKCDRIYSESFKGS